MDSGCGACQPRGLSGHGGSCGLEGGQEGRPDCHRALPGPRGQEGCSLEGLPGVQGAAGQGEEASGPQPGPAAHQPHPAGSGSEIRRICTATNDTVCSCRPGTQPRGGFKRGVGEPGARVCPRPPCHMLSPPPQHSSPRRGPVPLSQQVTQGLGALGPASGWSMGGASRGRGAAQGLALHAVLTADCAVLAADCAPCPPGHFSPGDNEACKPWTK